MPAAVQRCMRSSGAWRMIQSSIAFQLSGVLNSPIGSICIVYLLVIGGATTAAAPVGLTFDRVGFFLSVVHPVSQVTDDVICDKLRLHLHTGAHLGECFGQRCVKLPSKEPLCPLVLDLTVQDFAYPPQLVSRERHCDRDVLRCDVSVFSHLVLLLDLRWLVVGRPT